MALLSSFTAPHDASEAIAIQQQLRQQVRIGDDIPKLELIAGLDVGYDPLTNQSYAIGVLMRPDELKPIAMARAQMDTPFPYIPGLLSFREIPVLLAVLEKLPQKPDLLIVDGHGVAHPRRLGIAAHLGVLTDMPSIGVAKSKLTGRFRDPDMQFGATSPLLDKSERIGTVLRSKKGCLPLFISPGHRVGQETAVELVLQCLRGYRLPEPTRIADKYSKRGLREDVGLIV